MADETLAFPLPPQLVGLLGYPGPARYVAFWWEPSGDELTVSDGTVTFTGNWAPYLALETHPLGRVLVQGHNVGSSETQATDWLVADTWDQTVTVMPTADARALLGSQPRDLDALTDGLEPEEVARLADDVADAFRRRLRSAAPLSAEEVTRRGERQRAGTEQMLAWLDRTLEQIHGPSSGPDGGPGGGPVDPGPPGPDRGPEL